MKVLIAIPVFNAEHQLATSILRLHTHLQFQTFFDYEICIANNGSTDRTLPIARSLAKMYPKTKVSHLDLKGRGRMLKQVWIESTADICSYMDVDLSTNLSALFPMIQALTSNDFDIVIGSRLHPNSIVKRSCNREIISRFYNWIVRIALSTRFSDAQCGFKAITRHAALSLLPVIEDDGWFFDTELLAVAEKCGYRTSEIPVTWIENLDSRVKILPTALGNFKGLARLRRDFARCRYSHMIVSRQLNQAGDL